MLSAIFSGVGYLLTAAIYVGVIIIMTRTNKVLREENHLLRDMNIGLMYEVNRLKLMNIRTLNKTSNSYSNSDQKDIAEAVKFAMLQAHPDNPNGSHERFIKYKELYDRIK